LSDVSVRAASLPSCHDFRLSREGADRRGVRVWPPAKLLIAQGPEQLRDQLLVKGTVSKQERLGSEHRVSRLACLIQGPK